MNLHFLTGFILEPNGQNSEEKNSGVGVEHRGVCVECSKQTQNSKTNPKLGSKKSWGVH